MRIAITILGVLVVAVVAGGLILSQLIATEELRAGILEESEALTGGPLEIEGRLDLSFRPRPTLSFSEARFVAAGTEDATLEVDRVDLGVGVLALLTGKVEILDVRLVRPRLTMTRSEQAPVGLIEAIAGQALAPLQAGLTQLSVIDGSAVIHGGSGHAAAPLLLERVDLEVSGRSERGPFFVEGSFAHDGETYALEARLGRLTADPATTMQITLGTIADSTLDLHLTYRGIVSLDALSHLRGQVHLVGADLGRAARTLAPGAWQARLADAPPLAVPFDLQGVIESEGGHGRLDELRIEVAGHHGEGSLDFDLPAAEIALVLDLPALDLPDGVAGPTAFAPLIPITRGLAGTVDLAIGRLVRHGAAARDARIGLDLDPEGGIVVRQLRAVLPGDTDVALEGQLRAAPEGALDGRLTVVTDRLGDTLAWLGPDLGSDTLRGYRAMSLASGLVWTANAVRLDGIDGRLDASRIRGDLEVRGGDRPEIGADLEIDRLSLPAALAELSPGDAFAALADGVRRFDLDLDLEIGRLIQGGMRLDDLVVRGRAKDGRLELERVAVAAPAATGVVADGVVDANRERFEIQVLITSGEPGPLLRRLELAPPVSLARLGPLHAEIEAEGWLEGVTIEAEAMLGTLTARARGGLGLTPARAVEADLDVELVHPRYAQLLADLGLAREPERDTGGGPVAGAGKIRLDRAGRAELIGHLALGGTRVTGQVVRAEGSPRPTYEIRISLGEPRFADLLPLAGLAGFRLDGVATGRPLLGAWPRHPIDISDLGAFSGRLALSGKGGVVGDGLDAAASSENGRLVIENALLRLPGGEVEIKGELDAGGPVPRLSLTLEVRDLTVDDVLEPLGIGSAVTGRLDLFGRIAGVGDTPYDLVRSLRGDLTFSVEDGEVLLPTAGAAEGLTPTPLSLLEGRADVWRGVAELTRFDLDTADGVWQGEGAVDLLLWIVEVTLRNAEDAAQRVRIVGRPDDPQVRVEDLGATAPGD